MAKLQLPPNQQKILYIMKRQGDNEMKFTYTIVKEVGYLEHSDEYEEYGEDFDYEPEYSDIIDALADIIYDKYFNDKHNSLADRCDYQKSVKTRLRSFLSDYNDELYEKLCEDYYDELKDYFEEEAFDSL